MLGDAHGRVVTEVGGADQEVGVAPVCITCHHSFFFLAAVFVAAPRVSLGGEGALFSRCGAWAPELSPVVEAHGLIAAQHVESSQTRD